MAIQIKIIPEERMQEYALKHNLPERECNFCGAVGKYEFNNIVYKIDPVTLNAGLVINCSLPSLPFVYLSCGQCGHIAFINIYFAGLEQKIRILQTDDLKPQEDDEF